MVGCSTWFGPDAGVTHRVGYSWVTPELSQGVLLPSITCICNRISITILAFVSLWGWGNPCQWKVQAGPHWQTALASRSGDGAILASGTALADRTGRPHWHTALPVENSSGTALALEAPLG